MMAKRHNKIPEKLSDDLTSIPEWSGGGTGIKFELELKRATF